MEANFTRGCEQVRSRIENGAYAGTVHKVYPCTKSTPLGVVLIHLNIGKMIICKHNDFISSPKVGMAVIVTVLDRTYVLREYRGSITSKRQRAYYAKT